MSWERATLGSLIKPVSERSVPDAETELAYIGMEHVEAQSGRVLDFGAASKIKSSSPLVKPGDVLYGRLRPYLNKVAIAPREAYASGEFIVFRGSTRLDAKYLKWRLTAQDFVDYAVSLNAGDRPRVKWPQMAEFRLSVPPLEEQRRIVAILEDHLSRLDAAGSYLEAAAHRSALLSERLLSRVLEGTAHERTPFRELLTMGLANGRSVPTADVGFPVLRLTALRNGRVDLAERKLGAWNSAEAERFLVNEGDFLISRGSGSLHLVGRGGLVDVDPDPVAFPDTLIRARPRADALDPTFLGLVWNSPTVRRQIERVARTTAGIYKVNQKDLGSVCVPLPSLAEQRQIASTVASGRDALVRMGDGVWGAQRRLDALRRSLLAAGFSGRLTGSGPHV